MSKSLITEVLPREAEQQWWLHVENNLLASGDAGMLAERLLQYLELPERIVELLSAAHAQLPGWQASRREISENIGDESGGRTGGTPHVVILKRELERQLPLSLSGRTPNAASCMFIERMHASLQTGSQPYTAGAVYALETTAIPELKVVAALINRLAVELGVAEPIQLTADGTVLQCDRANASASAGGGALTLSAFFSMHVAVFEVDHRNHLAAAILKDMQKDDGEALARGFRSVLRHMDEWFSALL